MPTRPDLKQALGRDAVYGGSTTSPASGPSSRRPGRPKKLDGPTWEELHERATFHIPIELHDQIKAHANRTGRTKSSIVADAVASYLEWKTPKPPRMGRPPKASTSARAKSTKTAAK